MTKSLDNKLPGDKIQKINLYMNNNMLRIQEVDLTFLIFFSYFYFSSQFTSLYSIFRTSVKVRVLRSCCYTVGYIR